ncbi:ABC-three component system protein [Chromobacterium sp. Beijing]|uniref:ABC-three component system protein n=1 Tax=Chromobacterium sp. Beijing TaxID=2735795 RepID=UPI001F41CCAC|nr:ABC-three component system protein [Chromobacterium sp. Beijing]UJB31502.1 HNH endonuclease [Chromobacterium sp. Beijing]
MTNTRRNYNDAEVAAMLAQVRSRCPLCDDPLFYRKKQRQFKGYDLAHIYPLNPRPEEVTELVNSPRLCADVNDPDNIIPLCIKCHRKFDKPRTEDEYLELYQIKFDALQQEQQRSLASQYPLEQQITEVVAHLHSAAIEQDGGFELAFTPKAINDKLDATMPPPTKRKVRNAVEDYFRHVQAAFLELERSDPGCSELIFVQVKSFYVMQKRQSLTQAQVFANLVAWIRTRAKAQTLESAEAVASFFIQNCEVFE